MQGVYENVDQYISHGSGMKIGHEMQIYYQRQQLSLTEQDSEYANAEFFYDDNET